MNGIHPFSISCFVIFLLASSPHARAESLSVAEAVSLAKNNNFAVQLLRQDVELAKSKIPSANRRHNPQLGIGYRSDLFFENDGAFVFELEANQEIELGGQRSIRLQLANATLESTHLTVRVAEEQLAQQVIVAYYSARIAQDHVAFLKTIEEAVQQLRDTAQLRADQQAIPRSDARFLNLDYLSVKGSLDLLLARYREQIADLALMIGTASDSLVLTDSVSIEQLSNLIPDEESRFPGDSLFPLRSQSLRKEHALELTLAEKSRTPNLTIGLTYEQGRTISKDNSFDGSYNTITRTTQTDNLLGIRMSMPLPFFDRNQGGIAEARARQEDNEARIRLQSKLQSQLMTSHRNILRTALEAINSMVPAVSESNELITLLVDAYRGGRISIERYLAQRAQLQQVRETYFISLEQFVTLAEGFQTQMAEQNHVTDLK